MFDLAELAKLKDLGARRVRYPDGAEVEFDGSYRLSGDTWVLQGKADIGGSPVDSMAPHEETQQLPTMPSRAELQAEAEKLASAAPEGAPTVAP